MRGAVGHAAGRVSIWGSVPMSSVLNSEHVQVPAFALTVLQVLVQRRGGLFVAQD